MFPKILDRYVMRESTILMFTWVGAVTIIMLVQTLFELADFFVNKKVPFLIVLEILLLYLPAHMVMTFPISNLLAAELSLSRFCRDSELIAVEASGVSLRRFLFPYLFLALLVAFGSFLLNDLVVPETNHRAQSLVRYYVYKESPPQIEQNVFFRDEENRYFYVNEVDTRTWEMKKVIIYFLENDNQYPEVIIARTAFWLEDKWLIKDGVVHQFDEEGKLVREIEFSEMEIDMRQELKEFFEKQRTPEEMSSRQLKKQIEILKKAGARTEKMEVAYFLKFSIPFSAVVFVMAGMPLGIQRTRDTKGLGVIVTVILAFAYYMLLSIFRSLGRGGVMEPLLAAWMPDVIFGLMGIILFWSVDRR
ncbi:LptF/LptG family permease [Atrimonas thermophila]|uniref:LptF/LptG family permease n=1 Tax=Atrimonas thermophila TaxID=3064161 RepID=UPI00399C7057